MWDTVLAKLDRLTDREPQTFDHSAQLLGLGGDWDSRKCCWSPYGHLLVALSFLQLNEDDALHVLTDHLPTWIWHQNCMSKLHARHNQSKFGRSRMVNIVNYSRVRIISPIAPSNRLFKALQCVPSSSFVIFRFQDGCLHWWTGYGCRGRGLRNGISAVSWKQAVLRDATVSACMGSRYLIWPLRNAIII